MSKTASKSAKMVDLIWWFEAWSISWNELALESIDSMRALVGYINALCNSLWPLGVGESMGSTGPIGTFGSSSRPPYPVKSSLVSPWFYWFPWLIIDSSYEMVFWIVIPLPTIWSVFFNSAISDLYFAALFEVLNLEPVVCTNSNGDALGSLGDALGDAERWLSPGSFPLSLDSCRII